MAAPEALIRGSGGFLTNIDGSRLKFLEDKNLSQGGIIVGSKNLNHKYICETISKKLLK
jgi:3'-phosphoadenosine 5'-phosphosulfate (PAPS) 3'-phosphatase